MKAIRNLLPLLLVTASAALAQTAAAPAAPPSDAQKAFDTMKSMQGTWTGSYQGTATTATLRVTSMGHAIVHEMRGEGRADDPITMIYLDGDHLYLTHYCDAGNRPRMEGKLSEDGRTVDFTLLDVGNLQPTQGGHMEHATFTAIDPAHHTEAWTFAMNGQAKPFTGTLDLKRAK